MPRSPCGRACSSSVGSPSGPSDARSACGRRGRGRRRRRGRRTGVRRCPHARPLRRRPGRRARGRRSAAPPTWRSPAAGGGLYRRSGCHPCAPRRGTPDARPPPGSAGWRGRHDDGRGEERLRAHARRRVRSLEAIPRLARASGARPRPDVPRRARRSSRAGIDARAVRRRDRRTDAPGGGPSTARARSCDVFCEPGFFTPSQSERILRAALAARPRHEDPRRRVRLLRRSGARRRISQRTVRGTPSDRAGRRPAKRSRGRA